MPVAGVVMKRLFVGTLTSVPGIDAVRRALESFGLRGKWVEKHNLHFTYRFLGDVEDDKVFSIADSQRRQLEGVKAPVVEYVGVGAFPSVFKPKVVWIGVRSEGVIAVKRLVDKALLSFGFPEEGSYTPHLTVVRVKRAGRLNRLVSYFKSMEGHLFLRKPEARLHLVESRLTRKGPVYTVLEEILLD